MRLKLFQMMKLVYWFTIYAPGWCKRKDQSVIFATYECHANSNQVCQQMFFLLQLPGRCASPKKKPSRSDWVACQRVPPPGDGPVTGGSAARSLDGAHVLARAIGDTGLAGECCRIHLELSRVGRHRAEVGLSFVRNGRSTRGTKLLSTGKVLPLASLVQPVTVPGTVCQRSESAMVMLAEGRRSKPREAWCHGRRRRACLHRPRNGRRPRAGAPVLAGNGCM